MRSRTTLSAVVLLSTLFVSPTPAEDRRPVQIGGIFNLTGALSSLDQPALAGARLAVKHLNRTGGILGRTVELQVEDGHSDPATVTAIADRMVHTAHLSAITGITDTDTAIAAGKVAEKGRMVFLTAGATSPKLPIQFPDYFFMTCFGDNTQAAAGAEYAFNTLGKKKTYLLFESTADYTVLLANYFKTRYTELGGAIVQQDSYVGGITNFSAQIARIQALATPPDMLYVSANPSDVGPLVKQLRAAGLQQPIMGGDGYDTPLLLEIAGAAANNTYFTTHAFLDLADATGHEKRFIFDYEAEYGVRPVSAFAALGYDAIMLLGEAMERAGSMKQRDIAGSLERTQRFPGVTGRISFARDVHIPKKEVTILKVENGSLKLAAILQPQKTPAP